MENKMKEKMFIYIRPSPENGEKGYFINLNKLNWVEILKTNHMKFVMENKEELQVKIVSDDDYEDVWDVLNRLTEG